MAWGGGILDGLLGGSSSGGMGLLGSGMEKFANDPMAQLGMSLMAAPRYDNQGFAVSPGQQIGAGLKSFQEEMRSRRLEKLKERQFELGISQLVPSNIREWQMFQNMTPQQKREYLVMKRASQLMDLGGSVQPFDPLAWAGGANPPATTAPFTPGTETPEDLDAISVPVDTPTNGLLTTQDIAENPSAPVGLYGGSGGYAKSLSPEQLPSTKFEQAREAEKGKAMGEAENLLASMEANMPQINTMVEKLDRLSNAAAYTAADVFDAAIRRQLGVDVGSPAEARAKYISTVDNEILPLLRQTFGSQFTEQEGARLRATLGNENLSPPEKKAALQAFIDAKIGQIQSMQRRTGREVTPASEISTYNSAQPLSEAEMKELEDLRSKYGGKK